MAEMTARQRLQLQMHQERVGRDLKAQMVKSDVSVRAVADELGLANYTSLSQYLSGTRLWAAGLEDFKVKVGAAIASVARAQVGAA